MRCCIYKERAIVAERVKIAMGGDRKNPNVIEVIGIACDEVPVSGYRAWGPTAAAASRTAAQRTPRGSILSSHHAHIDARQVRQLRQVRLRLPLQRHPEPRAPLRARVRSRPSSGAKPCGAYRRQQVHRLRRVRVSVPLRRHSDKSFLLDAIHIIRDSENNQKYKVYAVVAPSISSQFVYAKLGQVIMGLKQLGFFSVVEAALGADMVSYREARELAEKGFLTSSCCPSFVSYIEKSFPTLRPFVSHNLSPMAEVARFIKGTDPDAKIIFIGPCTAKKQEFQREEVRPWIDCVLTFEELQAWFDSKDLDLPSLDEDVLDNASYFGRIFARSGGLTDAVKQALKEQGSDFIVNPIPCDGIEACRVALLKKQKNLLKENFIEGMACVGGCIGGAGCLTHGPKDKGEVDKYGHEAYEKTITAALAQCAYDTEK